MRCLQSALCLVFSIGTIVFPGRSLAQDLRSGLQGHWTFDEGLGTTAADRSGNGRDALFRNGEPLWVDGVFGGALEFDGASDLEVDWFGIEGNAARTVSFWVKSEWEDIQANNGIVAWGLSDTTGAKWHIRFHESNGAIRTEPQGGQSYGSLPLNDGDWHHVVSIFPEGGEFIEDLDHYVDGELEDKNGNLSVLVDTIAEDGGVPLTIGSRFQSGQGDGYWQGSIDDLRIYNRALSEEEVLALFAGQDIGGGMPGDLDANGILDAADIDLLSGAVRGMMNPPQFDLDADGVVNDEDRRVWVEDLAGSFFGDSNLDLEFNSSDFVFVFQFGQYEDEVPDNSTWATGDWNGDGEFTSSDFVTAFQAGGYEVGPRAANAVPEPSGVILLGLGGGLLPGRRRRKHLPSDAWNRVQR